MPLRPQEVRAPSEFEPTFSAISRERADAVIVLADAMFLFQRQRIVELAARHRLPTIYQVREFVDIGGLVSYGASLAESYHRVGTYVDKILKGAQPAVLPVEQPTKYDLVINLKTAKALGLTIPQSVLARADEVIQ
jgi:putative ABC transport system substrate-binding protein